MLATAPQFLLSGYWISFSVLEPKSSVNGHLEQYKEMLQGLQNSNAKLKFPKYNTNLAAVTIKSALCA